MQFTRVKFLQRRLNFELGARLVMAGTIQFAASIQLAREQLAPHFPSLAIPQSRPLSPGDPFIQTESTSMGNNLAFTAQPVSLLLDR